MPTVYWGAIGSWHVDMPATTLTWVLLLIYCAIFVVLLIRDRIYWRHVSLRQLGALVFLSGLAFVLSHSFPTQVTSITAQILPSGIQGAPETTLALLSAAPYLFAGAMMGPTPALVVGFFTGLGRSFGLSHLLFDPFHFAFAAWLAAQFMQQNYQSRLWAWLRLPLVSGIISQLIIVVLSSLIVLASVHVTLDSALDTALSEVDLLLWAMLLEGIVSGLLVTIIVKIWTRGRSSDQAAPSPHQLSIRRYMLANYLLFAAIMLTVGALLMFTISMSLSKRLQLAEMAANSLMASTRISDFQFELENELEKFGAEDEAGIVGDKTSTARALGRLYRASEYFQRLVLVDENQTVIYAYPPQKTGTTLTVEERAAMPFALNDRVKQHIISNSATGTQMLSAIVPVRSAENSVSVLIGRVPITELVSIAVGANRDGGHASSYILDDDYHLVAHISGMDSTGPWRNFHPDDGPNLELPGEIDGQAVLFSDLDRSRDLIYIAPGTSRAWHVAMVVPYEVVLNQALFFALPLAAIFLLVAAVFYVRVDRYGRRLSAPISELAKASRMIAKGGSLTTRVHVDRRDEIGELSQAFRGMQLALKGRLEELSLLLNVSQDISSSINITQGMPVVLQGALRGTGASGARALILNPRGKVPLSFSEGPAGTYLAVYDRPLMTLLREKNELALGSPKQMGAVPGLVRTANSPFRALYALPLKSNGRFLGIFFLGYRHAREFSLSEFTLLRTLASQATVLVENAYLYANAEGGRRRLAAVLASTTEAVIVTDQTDRILIINRAMERAFKLSSSRVKGRLLADVIVSKELVEALTRAEAGQLDLEIEGKDRRSYYVNVSPIVSQRGLIMGRVAVLHDITHFKEIDRLKSDFVSNVSHDLRTPLAVISGYATALAMTGDLSDEQREYADSIISSVKRMTGVVDKLLDLARFEAGVDLTFETIDVPSLLIELVEEHWLYAHESGVTIDLRVQRGLPAVTADRTSLGCAVSNLLSNAFKYAPDSGVMVLAAEQVADEVVIGLTDKGPGIAGQDQVQLFEKFYRVKRHESGSVKGTGLGLATIRTIAEQHGGRAWCKSELGKGSSFYFSVKIEREDSQESPF